MSYICKICDNKKNNKVYIAKEMMYGLRDEFEYFQCSQCDCLQIKDVPKDLAKYYPIKYYSFSNFNEQKYKGINGLIKKTKFGSIIKNSTVWQKTIKNVFYKNHLLNHIEINKESKILDVGSGNGSKFLYPLSSIGINNILGCDPFINEPIKYRNGLLIKKTDIFEIDSQWDLITFNHSYEHNPLPIETMKKVHELLTEGGVCMIRIPTVSSYAWQRYKTNWFQLDAPRHLYLHSIRSMECIAKKSQLELFKIVYDSTYKQFEASEKYEQNISLRSPRPKGFKNFVKRKMKKKKYKNMAKQLNLEGKGDQAAFFFRKV